MIKAHKIRLHPIPEQETYFARAAGTARYAFNWALAEWKRQYEAGEKPSTLTLRTQFHALRREQLPWTYDVTKCAIEGAFMDLAAAFKNFFEGRKAGRKTGHPKFKSKNRIALCSACCRAVTISRWCLDSGCKFQKFTSSFFSSLYSEREVNRLEMRHIGCSSYTPLLGVLPRQGGV